MTQTDTSHKKAQKQKKKLILLLCLFVAYKTES